MLIFDVTYNSRMSTSNSNKCNRNAKSQGIGFLNNLSSCIRIITRDLNMNTQKQRNTFMKNTLFVKATTLHLLIMTENLYGISLIYAYWV